MANLDVDKPNRTTNIVSAKRDRHEVLHYILKVKLAEVSNAYKARKESTNKLTDITKDIMNVSLTALGGAITIKIFADPKTIKTPILFYLAAAGLLLSVIFSLIVRLVLAHTWKTTNTSLGSAEENLRMVVGDMKYHDGEHHSQAFEAFEEAMDLEPSLDEEPWLARFRAIVGLVGVFIFCLILMAVSLLFKISVS